MLRGELMDYYIYSAHVNSDTIVNITNNPCIDLTVLNETFGVGGIEVLTPALGVSQADYVMRSMNREQGFMQKFVLRGSRKSGSVKTVLIKEALQRLGISPLRKGRIVSRGESLPGEYDIKTLYDVLQGRILSISGINRMIKDNGVYLDAPVSDILQALYLRNKLTVYPSLYIDEPYEYPLCRICGSRLGGEDGVYCPVCGSFAESDEPLFGCRYEGVNASVSPIKFKESRDLSYIQEAASEELCSFLHGDLKECLLWTIPGTENINITNKAIKDVLYHGGRCAFFSQCHEENKKVLECLKEAFPSQCILLYKPYNLLGNEDIVICSFDDIKSFYRSFDLIIINEANGYGEKMPGYIVSAAKRALKGEGKVIYATSTPDHSFYERVMKKDIGLVSVPVRNHGGPFPEPRVMTYRILSNGEFFIPGEVIDYILWSIGRNTQVYIIVPSVEYIEPLKGAIVSDERVKEDWVYGPKPVINVSTLFDSTVYSKEQKNVLVYFADDRAFNEKALLSAAGIQGWSGQDVLGEVVFVGSRESDEMYNTRMMMRFINKQAWEMGYLK
jgi:Superfamily II DNA/RNA helicase required for DNA uptake (late competence protein)